jgi:hypothetical protein
VPLEGRKGGGFPWVRDGWKGSGGLEQGLAVWRWVGGAADRA